jgi:hypothetical protein
MNKRPLYFPPANGRYETKPGLFPLGTDFGNGRLDHQAFQIDTNYDLYTREKRQTININLNNYYCTFKPSLTALIRISTYIAHQLSGEYPKYFVLDTSAEQITLHCRPLGMLKSKEILIPSNHSHTDLNELLSVINELLLRIQEDIALIEITENGEDYISLLHLCFPNYWSATEKIGKSFLDAHKPVPEMQSIQKRSKQLLSALIEKGPFVRFAWGLSSDQKLNHRQESSTINTQRFQPGRVFDIRDPKLYLRVERQVTIGFSDSNCFMFSIRTYFYDVAELRKHHVQRDALVSALGSMSEATLKYKGLFESKNRIIQWLINR